MARVIEGAAVVSYPLHQAPNGYENLARICGDRRIWTLAKPSILDPDHGGVRVSLTPLGQLVGASRMAPGGDGVQWRTVAIVPDFWGTDASQEVTAIELLEAFCRGVQVVKCAVPRDHHASLGRVRSLGWRAVGRREDLLLFDLNANDFCNAIGACDLGMRPDQGQ